MCRWSPLSSPCELPLGPCGGEAWDCEGWGNWSSRSGEPLCECSDPVGEVTLWLPRRVRLVLPTTAECRETLASRGKVSGLNRPSSSIPYTGLRLRLRSRSLFSRLVHMVTSHLASRICMCSCSRVCSHSGTRGAVSRVFWRSARSFISAASSAVTSLSKIR